jgi:hypothetical protein
MYRGEGLRSFRFIEWRSNRHDYGLIRACLSRGGFDETVLGRIVARYGGHDDSFSSRASWQQTSDCCMRRVHILYQRARALTHQSLCAHMIDHPAVREEPVAPGLVSRHKVENLGQTVSRFAHDSHVRTPLRCKENE